MLPASRRECCFATPAVRYQVYVSHWRDKNARWITFMRFLDSGATRASDETSGTPPDVPGFIVVVFPEFLAK